MTELDALKTELAFLRDEVEFLRNRTAVYVGGGTVLTHLADGRPFYVNGDDFGGPATLISGGRYEQDNLDVLLSFVRPDTVFVDVGANLGFFPVMVAQRLATGRVLAFEPHPGLAHLAWRNAHVNGLEARVRVEACGLSDRNAETDLVYPRHHLGGGSVHRGRDGGETVRAALRRLDDAMPPDFRCDLVKIDVEGHELAVLRGMEAILRRSPDVMILLEKLGVAAGNEDGLAAFAASLGLGLYAVEAGARLSPLAPAALPGYSGYVLATRRTLTPDERDRRRFTIYPEQLWLPAASPVLRGPAGLEGEGTGALLAVHGPYWSLPRGRWQIAIDGEVPPSTTLRITANMGRPVCEAVLGGRNPTAMVIVDRDHTNFETVLVTPPGRWRMALGGIRFQRAD